MASTSAPPVQNSDERDFSGGLPPRLHLPAANSTCNPGVYRGRLAHDRRPTVLGAGFALRRTAMPDIRPARVTGALVLNATYEPLCVVSVRRATILVLTAKAVCVAD